MWKHLNIVPYCFLGDVIYGYLIEGVISIVKKSQFNDQYVLTDLHTMK